MPDPRTASNSRALLARVSPIRAFLVTLALGLLGLFVPGIPGALLLYAIVATMLLLLRRSSVREAGGPAVLRVLILVVITAIATAKVIN
jgi:hypothetical protein